MNLLKTGMVCLLLSVCAARAAAQDLPQGRTAASKQPELFRDLPRQMNVSMQTLAPLVEKEIGARVTFPLASGILFSGIVVSKSDAAETRYKTVVLKCTDRAGAAFTLSAVRTPAGTYRYSGRMLSLHHSDAYELVEEQGQFALQKRAAAEIVSE